MHLADRDNDDRDENCHDDTDEQHLQQPIARALTIDEPNHVINPQPRRNDNMCATFFGLLFGIRRNTSPGLLAL
ncbi:MAG: hypothetical protein WBB98_09620 [Xanthobacteraceae bacterium]